MKTSENRLSDIVKSELLRVLIIFIVLVGLSIKANAQSPAIGTDVEKLQNSMSLQVNTSEFSILIPKVKMEDISAFTKLTFDQLVYVTDNNVGFYCFTDGKWNKVSIKDALEKVKSNLDLMAPETKNVILNGSHLSAKNMLDYNGHVEQMSKVFSSNYVNDNFAIRLND